MSDSGGERPKMNHRAGAGNREPAPDNDDPSLPGAATLPAKDPAAVATTVTPPSATTPAGTVDLASAGIEEVGFTARYDARRLLGRGGMGDVKLCKDHRVGREVALKVMRHAVGSTDAVARFLREARVQGQLEHPAIVPVYDLGVDPEGQPYFTMKRLKGMTLQEIISGLVAGDPEVAARSSRRKLLTEFANVCQAIEYAHTRGVIHRDLKPSNIMLGDFGEVYVLDWGVAKIAGAEEPGGDRADLPALAGAGTAATARGAVMGTPGYMAPEQLRGESDQLDGRSDVYGLGAILFEILTLEPLHPRTSAQAITSSTLEGVEARPSRRCPDREVPPELEQICVTATALDPADRFASAAALCAALERYLDGDRDLERRRAHAAEHAGRAAALARRVFDRGDAATPRRPDPGDAETYFELRSQAMCEASRALALDPTADQPMQILTRMMLEPPTEMPAEVEDSLAAARWSTIQVKVRAAGLLFLACFLAVPFYLWMGVEDWPTLIGLAAVTLVMAGIALAAARREQVMELGVYFIMGLNAVFLILTSRIFGSLILVPNLALLAALAMVITPQLRYPLITSAIACGAIVLPLVLELSGTLARSYHFAGGAMTVRANLLALPETATLITLTLMNCAVIIGGSLMMLRYRDAQMAVERRLHLQTWHLRQLVPAPTKKSETAA